ncbi:pilin [Candidatus Uhrbacteria bacterium]|nr:pilin [Candidatus Uhrbacteria bacterium]
MNSKQRTKNIWPVLALLLSVFLFFAPSGVHAIECPPQATDLTPGQISAFGDLTQMSCQNLSAEVTPEARLQRCISGACPGGTDTMCCMAGTGASRGRTTTEPAAPAAGGGGGALRLQLPACIQSGNCGLDDIVETGVNFANFLFGISGAIFLAIFVYAGFKYIFFASQASEVSSAKGMLVNATIGIILMFGASALVTTVYNAFRAGGSGGDARCTASYPANSCQPLSANWEDVTARDAEIRTRRCQPGLCGDGNRLVCCPTESGR